ncbi:ABC transporter ATP-binding protein [Alicyclobacillus sp. ALC3]|uniref:ABC transporter ATP-binding protein n=1 Tax=Alicyclobacillus sp. ALC3 TaxID=2796143 RepID=UPI00237A0474|nr:ABC transporter ATP-binding protein [Alicyclobacillus sp. ALC3]WDL98450.1 ABC transporter ATP-binding protein [Alicyclobacillus sp. ALC3]
MTHAARAIPQPDEAAIACHQVTFHIGNKQILNEVDFAVQQGEIAGLLGPNGAGKSTLLRIIAGISPPSSGQVSLFGEPAGVNTLADTAFLPDRGKLPGWLTCGEWMAFAERIYPDWDHDRAHTLSDQLEIRSGARIAALSRGEEARLQLLTCLARKARIVLLDEPFAGVDLISRQRIVNSVIRELAESHRSFLIATHDVVEMENLFDRVVLVGQGRIRGNHLVETLRAQSSSVEACYREAFE